MAAPSTKRHEGWSAAKEMAWELSYFNARAKRDGLQSARRHLRCHLRPQPWRSARDLRFWRTLARYWRLQLAMRRARTTQRRDALRESMRAVAVSWYGRA
jgi:hypothetical protein